MSELRRQIGDLRDGVLVQALATEVAEGLRDPYSASDLVLEGLEAIQRNPLV